MNRLHLIGFVLGIAGIVPAGELTVRRGADDAFLEILDDGHPVLRYNFATVPVPAGVTGKYAVARGDYVHPLYGPNGEVLTKDYSPDHPHHRGLYWAWPEVYYKGQVKDLHALQGVYARPDKILKAEGDEIVATNKWMWDDKEAIVSEQATIRAMPATEKGRAIDFEFRFTALVDGVSIARRGQTHYGGFNLRFSARPDQKILTHTDGATASPRRCWAQLVGTPPGGKEPIGVGIIQSSGNPEYPGDWVKYENLNWLQPTFPAKGVKFPLDQSKPLVLKFRLWIARGATDDATMTAIWDQFNAGGKP